MKEGNHLDILITGADGQLGKELTRRISQSYSVITLGRKEMEITKQEDVEQNILKYKPKIVIHTAAFTKVDQCEIDRKQAFEVNCLGTGYVAQAASKIGARMFYISSDYVFDGQKCSPYSESDLPNPQSIYGMSKWLGERLVLYLTEGSVIRTSWLYGHEGNNFVKTMLELAKQKKEIRVVNDQIGSPTYVKDLAEAILELLDKKNGIYHVSNSGSCTWYEFAQSILTEAGYNSKIVHPITTEEFGALAPRPNYSVLGHQSLHNENVQIPRFWYEALKEFIRKEIGQ
jgi:dTDP-4-dehydrorhamnose reductase